MQPLVSILIPVFNREALLRECVASACQQAFVDFEVVIVDNASTDDTWAICQSLAIQDPRIRVFRNEMNIGPVRNWERCLVEARGTLGKLLFSDDLIDPLYLAHTVPEFEDDEVGLVLTAAEIGYKPGTGKIVYRWANDRMVLSGRQFNERLLLRGDTPVSPCIALFRVEDLKKSFQLALSVEDLSDMIEHGAGLDLLLLLLTAERYARVIHVGRPLVFFRAHENSISIERGNEFINTCHDRAKLWFAFCHGSKFLQDRLAVRSANRQRQQDAIKWFYNALTSHRLSPPRAIWLRYWLIVIFDKLAVFVARLARRLSLT